MAYIDESEGARSAKKLAGLGIVLVLHVGLFYALANGLAQSVVQIISTPVQVKILDAPEVKKELPPPPPPAIKAPPPPFVAAPEININLPPPTPRAITQVQSEVRATPTAPVKPAPVVQAVAPTAPRSDPSHKNAQPEYPPAARRFGEEGRVVMRLYILPNGSVGQAEIVRSSGSDRLDQAALDEAKASWRFLPATQDGKPVAAWLQAAVVFKLEGDDPLD
ncbi:MAG: energy transducer TonB [Parvibaculaceae bacterium]|nr:energy transducer TonB [Parvibaculaceae bacterium]